MRPTSFPPTLLPAKNSSHAPASTTTLSLKPPQPLLLTLPLNPQKGVQLPNIQIPQHTEKSITLLPLLRNNSAKNVSSPSTLIFLQNISLILELTNTRTILLSSLILTVDKNTTKPTKYTLHTKYASYTKASKK